MQVLDGIRVIDLAVWAAGPGAAGILAHWGADVIKVESPRGPDPVRFIGGSAEPGGASVMFKHYNRGKRAVSIDIASDDGYAVLRRLVEGADVFLTSHLTATRQKLKIDVDDIRAMNPAIVYAKVTGQGPHGPDAEVGGFDLATFWCRGGLADTAAKAAGVDVPPSMVGHGDGVAAFTLASGVCAALLQRERSGTAPVVDATLLGTAMWMLGPNVASAQFPEMATFRSVPREMRGPSVNGYRTKDGRYLQLVFLGGQADWTDFFERIGRPDLVSDERFANIAFSGPLGGPDGAAAVAALDELFAERTFEEWRTVLQGARGVWAPVQSVEELYDDPQTTANGFIRPVDDAPDGLKLVAPPVLFDEDAGVPGRAPDIGEHTDEVLGEVGFSPEELTQFRAQGVIG